MSDLFRAEALEHHSGSSAPDVPPTEAVWLGRLYWLLFVLVAAGLAAGWCVRVDGDRLLLVLVGNA